MDLLENLEIVIIVGCQRTGTTLVGNILGAHPQALLIDEPDGLYSWLNALFERHEPAEIDDLFRKCCTEARKKYISPEGKCTEDGTLADSVTHLILKAPNLTYAADQILEFFPKPIIVFTYRDIRDVVVSMGRLDWIPMVRNQLRLIGRYPQIAERYSAAISRLECPDISPHVARAHVALIKTELRTDFDRPEFRKFEVQYESLVAQPEEWFCRLFAHCGLATFDVNADQPEVLRGWGPGLTFRKSMISSAAVGQWRSGLTRDQESEVWEVTASLMHALGYDRQSTESTTAWDRIESELKQQPVIATGRGGSGTRLLSSLLQSLGIFIGNKLNPMEDSLEWVPLLYKIAIERMRQKSDGATGYWQEALRQTAAEVLGRGGWNGRQPWGWKLPETMLTLPEVFNAFPGGRLIHLVRHPVDASLRRTHMTSRADNMVGKSVLEAAYESLGWEIGKITEAPEYLNNAASWLYQVRNVCEFGRETLGKKQYLEVRYEDLCENPHELLITIAGFLEMNVGEGCQPIEIEPGRLRSWSPPDSRADEIWELCGEQAEKLGYASLP